MLPVVFAPRSHFDFSSGWPWLLGAVLTIAFLYSSYLALASLSVRWARRRGREPR